MAYNLGPVRAHVKAAADIIGPMFNIKVIHGWRAKDQFMGEHPAGLALDVMCDIPTGTAVCEYLIANHQALAVRTIIHNGRSWNSTRKTWVSYTSTDNPHTDHVHILFWAVPGSLNVSSPISNPFDATKETLQKLDDLFKLLGDTNTWIRVSMFIGGGVFIAIGVFGASRVKREAATIGRAMKEVGKRG